MSIHYPEAEKERQRRAKAAKKVVTGPILGDPPADLEERRADAARRAQTKESIKTGTPVFTRKKST